MITITLFLFIAVFIGAFASGYALSEDRFRKRGAVVSELRDEVALAPAKVKLQTVVVALTPTPAPPTAKDVADVVSEYVRYDGRTTWDKVEHIVGQPGADVSGYRGESWFLTPLMSAYIEFKEALDAKIDGSRETKKILHVIRLLLDHGADPRMINNRGETVRTRLESTRQFHSGQFQSEYDPEVLLPILDQAIEMLREGEEMMQVQEDRTALIGSMGGISETPQAQPRTRKM
jgi:hypothetical protein